MEKFGGARDKCGSVFNESTEREAAKCLRQHGIFFDGCSLQCEREMSFLRLSQGFELEHFVYGYVRECLINQPVDLPKLFFQLFPILVVLVVVANVLVVLVLSQKNLVNPTNVVLKYMAIADLCVGLVPLPWNFFYHTLRWSLFFFREYINNI